MNIKKMLKAAEEKNRAIVRKKILKAAKEKNRATVAKIQERKSRNLSDEEGGKIWIKRQGYIVPKSRSITLPSIGQEGAFRPKPTVGIMWHMKSGTKAKTYTQTICLKKTVKPKPNHKIKAKRLDPVTDERLNKIWIDKQNQMKRRRRQSKGGLSDRKTWENELYIEKGRIIPLIRDKITTNSLNDLGLLILLMSYYLNQGEIGWQFIKDKFTEGSRHWFKSHDSEIKTMVLKKLRLIRVGQRG